MTTSKLDEIIAKQCGISNYSHDLAGMQQRWATRWDIEHMFDVLHEWPRREPFMSFVWSLHREWWRRHRLTPAQFDALVRLYQWAIEDAKRLPPWLKDIRW